ncbi:MAG: urease accessory protein UreD [Kordiimonadaceae bacterium]|nr:urease accessory protein UreD [Kordiimonadaceae bacterium]
MLDDASLPLQRSEGRLELHVGKREQQTVLSHLFQEGCLQARFPKDLGQGPKNGILINTAGGIADGDKLHTKIHVAEGAFLALTSQAAERIYRARDMHNPACLTTELTLENEASLYWLPQETIVFDQSAVERHFQVDMAADASFMGCEMVVLGRTAMGEKVRACNFFDRWHFRRDGKLVFADAFRLEGDVDNFRGQAQLGKTVTYASFFYVGNKAGDMLETLRPIIASCADVVGGCSQRHDLITARFATNNAQALRKLLAEVISVCDLQITGNNHAADAILPRWIF